MSVVIVSAVQDHPDKKGRTKKENKKPDTQLHLTEHLLSSRIALRTYTH